jgi:hypothetical protein
MVRTVFSATEGFSFEARELTIPTNKKKPARQKAIIAKKEAKNILKKLLMAVSHYPAKIKDI